MSLLSFCLCLSVRLSVIVDEITIKGGQRSDFFSRKTGLIVWWHESKSLRNPSSRSGSSQKVEEKSLLLSPHVPCPGKAFMDHTGI